MSKGYNELVGIQATFSRVIPRYRLTHHYRWRNDGETATTGTLRGYDMHRHIPISEILHNLADAYAPAVLSIWHQVTEACFIEYLQFETGATPGQMHLDGEWRIWAEL
ncbi:MAG: hypothetical protein V3W44_10405 [Dehalococcoidales bacterium]